jgi:hypothetical protein
VAEGCVAKAVVPRANRGDGRPCDEQPSRPCLRASPYRKFLTSDQITTPSLRNDRLVGVNGGTGCA